MSKLIKEFSYLFTRFLSKFILSTSPLAFCEFVASAVAPYPSFVAAYQ